MVTTQAYTDVLNMAFLLPLIEQRQLIRDMQVHVNQIPSEEGLHPLTLEERRARIRKSEEQIACGEIYTEEESDRMFDEYLTKELGIAL